MLDNSVQIEIDTSFLYKKLSEQELDPIIAKVYDEMSKIEGSHAEKFAEREGDGYLLPDPSWRARVLNGIGRLFGYQYVLAVLLDTETSLAKAILTQKKRQKVADTGMEKNHVKVLMGILDRQKNVGPNQFTRFENRHQSIGGNAIRAAVLGGNDGLFSNFSLMMGIAGVSATSDTMLMAGFTGLMAGALSMALGEWISVKSAQELYENQMQLEMEEIEMNPEGEQQEIKLIYMAKGIPEDQAKMMAADLISDKDMAHQFLVKEELGIQKDELQGSAWEAAIFSFFAFAIGAFIPIIPVLLFNEISVVFYGCIGFSVLGMFLIGTLITLFTNKNVFYSGMRQVIFGLVAAAITFGLGKLLGNSLLN